MSVIYIYVLDTLADWEIGHVISELNSGRFFKKEAEQVSIKYVGYAKLPIKTMGGLTIVPDCEIEEVEMKEAAARMKRSDKTLYGWLKRLRPIFDEFKDTVDYL